MKRLILVVAAVGVAIGLGLHVKRPMTKDVAAAETVAEADREAEIRVPVQEVSEPKLDSERTEVGHGSGQPQAAGG
jgi:hypothetical protein